MLSFLLLLLLFKVLASQKRMENKYKAAEQSSEDWYYFSLDFFIFYVISLNGIIAFTGIAEHNWHLVKVMRSLPVKH